MKHKVLKEKYESPILKIGQNTEKSPGDLRGLAVTQTPVRNADVKNSQKSKIMIRIIVKIKSECFYKEINTKGILLYIC